MKSFFMRTKFQYYLITFIVAIVFFVIEDVRPSHVLDSFILYGYAGHIIILVLSFVISIYLGVKNAYLKWLYPFCVAGFMHTFLPLFFEIVIYRQGATHFFIYYIFFGFFIFFLPHAIVPLLGIVVGKLAYKYKNTMQDK
ncbi:MAG: hypothetical protein FWE42_06020 [Defluviitaleaceae bacterium]|nr:hypothetical protein [Defluviitaleaceae bacterium]